MTKEGEPIEVEIDPYLDSPEGVFVDPEDYLNQQWLKAFGKEYCEDMQRLKELREQAHDLGCECKQCRGANLAQRKAIVRKWRHE